MASPLLRLLPYHRRYGRAFCSGAAVLLLARVFEALIPLFLRDGIDLIAAGRAQIADSGEPLRKHVLTLDGH